MQTAKIFMNGRSQAVRLPAEFRFDGDEVYISHDPETGDVVLSAKPKSWEGLFDAIEAARDEAQDFLADRSGLNKRDSSWPARDPFDTTPEPS